MPRRSPLRGSWSGSRRRFRPALRQLRPALMAAFVGDAGPSDLPTSEVATDLPAILGRNLRRLRTRQGHSLERLAKASGVSRAMLGQIENGKSTPTIGLLWKIATALGLPFATLLDSQETRGNRCASPRQGEDPGFQRRQVHLEGALSIRWRAQGRVLRTASSAEASGECRSARAGYDGEHRRRERLSRDQARQRSAEQTWRGRRDPLRSRRATHLP